MRISPRTPPCSRGRDWRIYLRPSRIYIESPIRRIPVDRPTDFRLPGFRRSFPPRKRRILEEFVGAMGLSPRSRPSAADVDKSDICDLPRSVYDFSESLSIGPLLSGSRNADTLPPRQAEFSRIRRNRRNSAWGSPTPRGFERRRYSASAIIRLGFLENPVD